MGPTPAEQAVATAWLGPRTQPLVLASASPRRRDILRGLGIACDVVPCPLEEDLDPRADPAREVERLARMKAADVASRVGADRVVLGADTVVSLDGRILGKPTDPGDARHMLDALSGRTHDVFTGVAVVRGGAVTTAFARTQVHMVVIPPDVLDAYLATEEPYDKAGAYGAQGLGRSFIDRVDGCFFNVMGLPVVRTLNLLRKVTADG